MSAFVRFLRSRTPRAKMLGFSAVDSLLLFAALMFAYMIRLGFDIPTEPRTYAVFILAVLVAIPVLTHFGLHSSIARFVTSDVVIVIAQAVTITTLVLVVITKLAGDVLLPRSVIFLYWFSSIAFLYGWRLVVAAVARRTEDKDQMKSVAIFGAGEAGYQLFRQMSVSGMYNPVVYIDDSPVKHGRKLAGLSILSRDEFLRKYAEASTRSSAASHATLEIDEVFVAIPSASRQVLRDIAEWSEATNARFRRLPSLEESRGGNINLTDLREVSIEDIVGRGSHAPDDALLAKNIKGKTVMITGAGGSIGSELCRQILRMGPTRLLLYERSEENLYHIDRELRSLKDSTYKDSTYCDAGETEIVSVLGCVLETDCLGRLMNEYRIQTVYHAAAYKHVPLVEANVIEGFRNNIIGTLNVAELSRIHNVETFVLVSTDKAVRPTNVMGATKRLAELVVQGIDGRQSGVNPEPLLHLPQPVIDVQVVPINQATSKTRFVCVRFGNVLDSSGSVVPLFRSQIEAGGPVTVTHPEVYRYFMTIPEAAQLVIQAGAMSESGDICLLDMGEPVSIYGLARRMIRLSGQKIATEKGSDGIEIRFVGLRPGEKLREELLIDGTAGATQHSKIWKAEESDSDKTLLRKIVREIADLDMAHELDTESLQPLLNLDQVEYRPEIVAPAPSLTANDSSAQTVVDKV